MSTSSAAAPWPSETHAALHTTALAFLKAQTHTPSLATAMDYPALRALTTESYVHTIGPLYSAPPPLGGEFTFAQLQEHLERMTAGLLGWSIRVEDVVVDAVALKAVVRAVYGMVVRGAEEVESEVVWMLGFEQDGEGVWRVGRSREIVDFGAGARVRELKGCR